MTSLFLDILLVDDSDTDVEIIREAISEIQNGRPGVQGSPVPNASVSGNSRREFPSLRVGGVTVNAVRDGDEALKYLRREGPYADKPQPRLMILDINMPKKTGFEILRILKSDPVLKSLPVIILTTSRRPQDVRMAYEEGAASYIVKPLKYADLREVLATALKYWNRVCLLPDPPEGD
ncbi:response regulator [bacterium]|nr:response regulator [bacterium]